MKWNQVVSILCLLVLIFPNTFMLNPPNMRGDEGLFCDDTPIIDSTSTPEITSQTTSSDDSSSDPTPPDDDDDRPGAR